MRAVERMNTALKATLKVTAALVVGVSVCPKSGAAQAQAEPSIHAYESVGTQWGQLPAGRTWGAPTGIKIDADGKSVWVLERCGDYSGPGCLVSDLPAVLKFDSSGNLVKSFGAGMFNFPHALALDHEGNVWVVDGRGEEGKGNQVSKFSPDGELLMTLGVKGGVPIAERDSPTDFFWQPDDVVVAPNGNVFVAEGHTGNATNSAGRILKFNSDGEFLLAWGQLGSEPGQFNVPHGMAMDSQGRLFVADRGNRRVQIFDQDGKFIDAWTQFGTPSGLFITADDVIYVADYEAGIRWGSARDGTVAGFIQAAAPANGDAIRVAETMAVDADGVIYAGENAGMKLMRFVLPR